MSRGGEPGTNVIASMQSQVVAVLMRLLLLFCRCFGGPARAESEETCWTDTTLLYRYTRVLAYGLGGQRMLGG